MCSNVLIHDLSRLIFFQDDSFCFCIPRNSQHFLIESDVLCFQFLLHCFVDCSAFASL